MLIYVDHSAKTVYPIDLKTSGHAEWDFYDSFVQWNYQIQARLYWRLIRATMDQDPYWADYALDDYRFIVVNKNTLTPLVWKFGDTKTVGTLYYGKNSQIEMKDPFDIGQELDYYLKTECKVPVKINDLGDNSITAWLNEK